jgi:predicted dehydrogenase
MVRIGIVGVGFMGMIHYLAARKAGLKVQAISSRDPKKRAGDWTSIRGNFGPAGKHEDLTGVTAYADHRELLADPAVDLVDICLPIANHADVTIEALEAGKHVLVEKAIAMTVADADRMIAAAERNGRVLMVAHVLPFFPEFRFVFDAVRDGRYGAVKAAHFRRHISPPDWSADIGDSAKSGGPVVDLHIHDTHFIRTAFGAPSAVVSSGLFHGPVGSYVSTQYRYGPNGPVVSATSGAISAKGRPFTHGCEVYFERGTIFYEPPAKLTVFTDAGSETPDLGSDDPVDSFAAELTAAASGVTSGKAPDTLSATAARDALALCFAEADSARTSREVRLG